MLKPFIIKDSREQTGFDFVSSSIFSGTKIQCLKTGDYSIEGLENEFVIERKASVSEISSNIFQERFEKELIRLDEFKFPFLVCEFDFGDIMSFPRSSGIPAYKWKYLKVTPALILKRIQEIQLAHPKLNIVFAGDYGKEYCESLFRRIWALSGPKD